jgi:CubicO group peptidase (beta-lactamase class C family)
MAVCCGRTLPAWQQHGTLPVVARSPRATLRQASMRRLHDIATHLMAGDSVASGCRGCMCAGAETFPTEDLVRWSRSLVTSGELPCAAVLVAQRGKLLLCDAFGPLRQQRPGEEAPPGIDQHTLFRLYSMTKPIVAAAAMALVDEGTLSLSDPLVKFFPGMGQPRLWSGGTAHLAPTVQHLLQHRAGVHCHDFGALFAAAEAQLASFGDPHQRLETTMDMLASEPLVHEPGEDFVCGYPLVRSSPGCSRLAS